MRSLSFFLKQCHEVCSFDPNPFDQLFDGDEVKSDTDFKYWVMNVAFKMSPLIDSPQMSMSRLVYFDKTPYVFIASCNAVYVPLVGLPYFYYFFLSITYAYLEERITDLFGFKLKFDPLFDNGCKEIRRHFHKNVVDFLLYHLVSCTIAGRFATYYDLPAYIRVYSPYGCANDNPFLGFIVDHGSCAPSKLVSIHVSYDEFSLPRDWFRFFNHYADRDIGPQGSTGFGFKARRKKHFRKEKSVGTFIYIYECNFGGWRVFTTLLFFGNFSIQYGNFFASLVMSHSYFNFSLFAKYYWRTGT